VQAARWRMVYLIAGAAIALELACRLGLISPINMVPPSEMVMALGAEIVSGAILTEAARTLACVAASVVIASLGGIALGAALHRRLRLRRALNPILASYYAIPIFVFYPGLAAVMGLGVAPIIITSVLTAIVGMVIASIDGLDRFPRVLSKVARLHGFNGWERFWHLQLPAAAPSLLAGAKLVVAYSFIGVIGSEFLMAPAGLGYEIAYAYNNFNVPRMYGLMLFVVLVVAAMNALLNVPERRIAARAAGRRET
jgi:NitT/TauT family transport system permease protein